MLNEVHYLVEPADLRLVSQDNACVISNFVEQAEWLEYAGIGFGEDRTLLIQKAIKRLVKTSGASSLKFFGRILCTEQDYWVAQGVMNQAEEAPLSSNQEPRGKGINATVYWVAHDLRKDWI